MEGESFQLHGVLLCRPRLPALLHHLWHSVHWTEPLCSSTDLFLSRRHLCLLRSPRLLKVLPHSLHTTTCSWGAAAVPLVTLLASYTYVCTVCTARPPLLLNHLSQLSHCTASACSLTGFLLSAIHLWRALSLSLLKHLPVCAHTHTYTHTHTHTRIHTYLKNKQQEASVSLLPDIVSSHGFIRLVVLLKFHALIRQGYLTSLDAIPTPTARKP